MISRSQELMKEKEKEREEATLPESMDFKKAEIATANRVFHDAIVSSLNQIVTQRIFDSGESGIISTIITTLEQTIVDVQRENSHVILTAKESYVYDKLENKFSESHASLLVRAIPILREKLKAYGDNLDEINKNNNKKKIKI